MLHLKNTGLEPKDSTGLLSKARSLGSDLSVTVRDCRVSSKYIEFDVSINKSKIDELVEKLKPIAELDHARQVVEQEIEKEKAIEDGIFYFNNERFWECHEVFEGVWKNCYEGERDLVQGLILVAAALVHFQKAEENICMSIFARALEKLSKSSGDYYGINVDMVRDRVTQMTNTGKISTFKI